MTRKHLTPIIWLFAMINIVLAAMPSIIKIASVNFKFITVVNLMLFAMSIFNFLRVRKMDASNPHAMVRSVMVGTLLKMVVFAGAALIYATQKKGPVGITTLMISMGMYLLYTWMEIQWTIKKQ